MIDFNKLKSLMASARDASSGKPLDSVHVLHKHHHTRHDALRKCKLFFSHIRDEWTIQLHGNTIAKIKQLPNDAADVTIHSVKQWPTITTGNRLAVILGCAIWSHGNKLRANITNSTHSKERASYRTFPPLVDGQMFRIDRTGTYCINPEVVKETRERVVPGAAAPIVAQIKEIRRVARAMARVGTFVGSDLRGMNRPFDIAGEVDAELVTHILRAGAGGIYRRSVGNDTAIPYDVCMDLLERGIRIIRETEYRKGGVYETYEHSFAGQFTKV